MSLITFDYQCKECGAIEERRVKRSESEHQACYCRPQGSVMRRMPAGPTTTFKFHDRSAVKSKKAVSLRDANPGVTRAIEASDI